MNIHLDYRVPCALCGTRLRGIAHYPARVNKQSIRTTGTGLIFTDHRCYECGHPHDSGLTSPDLWAMTAETVAEVAAYRERRFA